MSDYGWWQPTGWWWTWTKITWVNQGANTTAPSASPKPLETVTEADETAADDFAEWEVELDWGSD